MKVRWSHLTQDEKRKVGIGCGPGKTAFLIPQFIFKASCVQHDFYYKRGGNIFDKLEADAFFLAHMLRDIAESERGLTLRLFFTLMAFAYYLVVSVFGMFAFHWGKYRTVDEMISDTINT